MKDKPKIFSDLERTASLISVPISWLDPNCVLLGANDATLRLVGGATTQEQVIGKTTYDFYPKDVADVIVKNIKQVAQEKRTITFEESLVDRETDKTRWFLTTRSPLFDDEGVNVVGVIETTVEITDRKEKERLEVEAELQKIKAQKIKVQEQLKFKKLVDQAASDTQSPLAILLVLAHLCMGLSKEKIFATLKSYTALIPLGICWLDINNVYMGFNECAIKDIGGKSIDDFIGKTMYDFHPREMSDHILHHNTEVMRTGKVLIQEGATTDVTTGEVKYFNIFKAPLFDDTGKVIGILGVSVDITTLRRAEQLKFENEVQKARFDEQEGFRKVVDQVVHDIRSPLASLLMIVKACEKDIPEQVRIVLREAAMGIGDITNNLLGKYKEKDKDLVASMVEGRHLVMLSLAILQLLSEKKHQYRELSVEVAHDFCSDCNFIFITAEPVAFKRMLSNLVNNAAEAFDKEGGEVRVGLNIEGRDVRIIIEDNGKGMPQEVVDKITNNIPVTFGKKNGNGIGFTQICDTLQRNNGKIEINTKMGKGTKIILTFPLVETPAWVAKEISISRGDTIVILDDDSSIHYAWKSNFEKYSRDVNLKHFTEGAEAISFINNFPQKEKIFLLVDFELLQQELNGIHVIERTKVRRSILVTSHYANLVVRDLVIKNRAKILPKSLASEIPIKLIGEDNSDKNVRKNTDKLKRVDMVLIDDSKMFADSLAAFFEGQERVVDKYYSYESFLSKVEQYAKDTIVFIDNDLRSNISGIELAEQLHQQGYIRLYLLSGMDFAKGEIPDYLMAVSKADTDRLLNFIGWIIGCAHPFKV